MIPPEKLINFFQKKDNFLIATHINPDGDGLGSSIALSMALEKLGKKTALLCKDPVPHQYRFLSGQENFYSFDSLQPSAFSLQFDNLILIDCNDINRLELESFHLSTFNFQQSLVIDHHKTERDFGDIKWIMPDSAATGLMIYYLIKELGVKITEEMAINLYAAIAVDTGNFRYENTTSEVFRIAADLVEAGAVPHVIYREIFESWSDNRFNLFVKMLNTLQSIDGVAIVRVTKEMITETAALPGDIERFVDFPRIMKSVKVSVLFREIGDNHYKISLRSRDDINVATLAEAFGGGGHKNAAGCKIKADFKTAKSQLLTMMASQKVL